MVITYWLNSTAVHTGERKRLALNFVRSTVVVSKIARGQAVASPTKRRISAARGLQ